MTSRDHGALYGLPEPYLWLLPELLALDLPEETRATCASCVMLPAEGEDPAEERFFSADARCCTYHPSLPNHRLGRILNDGGPGAELVRARLADRDGVNAHSLDPTRRRDQDYEWGPNRVFGRDHSLRCPYWVGGDLACGVWQYREAVCRTWFCRHVDGVRGTTLWHAVRAALMWVDDRLAIWVCAQGQIPSPQAPLEEWVAWYRWCDERVSVATRAEVEALENDRCRTLRRAVCDAHEALTAPWPAVVEPAVARMEPTAAGTTRVYGGARFDPLEVPQSLFQFLALLDGHRAWSEALELAGDEVAGEVTVDLVGELLLRGALKPPEAEGEGTEQEQ